MRSIHDVAASLVEQRSAKMALEAVSDESENYYQSQYELLLAKY